MTEERIFCPECESMSGRRIEHRQETLPVRGVPITVDADVAICLNCGQAVEDRVLDEATLGRAYAAYRQQYGIIAPDQIRALRERYGLSQRAFGRLLGWGEITVHRYETGAIPDGVHNDLLLLLQDEEAMHKFVARHEDRLSERDRQVVDAAITGRAREMNEFALRTHLRALIESRSMADRGNRRFDFERLEQMIVFFVERLRPSRTKLNKLLWYADFLAFKRHSVSLSGTPYLRFQYGPVPEQYERLVAEVVSDGLVTEVADEAGAERQQAGQRPAAHLETRIRFGASMFSVEERAVLEAVRERFADLGAAQIRDISHEERAWRETPEKQVIPYALAADLSLA